MTSDPRREIDYLEYWEKGFTWAEFAANEIHEHVDLWHGIYKRTKCPPGNSSATSDTRPASRKRSSTRPWHSEASVPSGPRRGSKAAGTGCPSAEAP